MNGIAGLVARIGSHCRLFLDCDDFEAASGRFTSHRQKEAVARFERWYPHRVRAVTTNTNFMQGKLESWGVSGDQISYLPNGIERAWASSFDADQVTRLRWELDLADRKVIAYIGSLSMPSHPVDILLHAFSTLLADHPRAVLLLVGGGESLAPLKSLANHLGIQPAVRFAGQVRPDQVACYYRLAHVSVEPVHDDDAARGRCPLKLFESWASEVPFVTADVGDRRVLLDNESAGLLARAGDAASFAQKIGQALDSAELCQALRRSGIARVARFYWENLAGDLVNFYLADERRPT
jgi:glycosyltransferase involved in cell wall biosynthesis